MAGITITAIIVIGSLAAFSVYHGMTEAMLGLAITAIAGLGGYHIRCKKNNENHSSGLK